MKKKIGVMLTVILLLVSLLGFTGCSKVGYNAKIIDATLKESFLKENRVGGSYYLNDEWLNGNENVEKYIQDETSPKTRTFIITEAAQAQDVFEEVPEADFEKQMLVIHIYTDIYLRANVLKRVKLEDDILKIDFKIKANKSGNNDARMPYQRALVVSLDSLDITEVSVTEIR